MHLYIEITPFLMYYNINRRAKKELTEVCGTYESDCSRCPKKTECDEYNLHKIAEMLRPGESTVERSPGADDGRPERENMKNLIGNNLKRLFIFILRILPIQTFLCVRGIFILCVIRNPSMRVMRALCVQFKIICVRYVCSSMRESKHYA